MKTSRLVVLRSLDVFIAQLARFFARSEILRQTTSGAEFVRCVLDEAACAAEMTLLVLPVTPRFSRFFRVLAEVANLVDKLHDVAGDWLRGEVAVRPGLALRLRLLVSFASRLPALLFFARRRLRLLAWGAKYVLPPGRGGRGRRTAGACYPAHPR
ncbi:MAG TPA: hypothetical protein VHS09_06400, partial [Polyangiaceae bacterium]|nr:hypothetical protein [Polyangiaceae bacterium]